MMKGTDTFYNEPSLRQRSHLRIHNVDSETLSPTVSKTEALPFVQNAVQVTYNTIPRSSTSVDNATTPTAQSRCQIL